MYPDFSEFSYGYAVTEEIVTKYKARVIGAPRFPSLYEEGKKGGYDVKIPLKGIPIFLQFKLSDYLERTNAKEHKSGLLGVPYYRMSLRPTRHSDQHQLLIALELSGETVFYITPEFHLSSELNKHYLNKQVLINSAAFSPTTIGLLPDQDDHYIVFKKWSAQGFMCSDDPIPIRKVSLEGGFSQALISQGIKERELGAKWLKTISEQLLNILESREAGLFQVELRRDAGGIREIASKRPTIEAIGYMCRTFFNTELIVLADELNQAD